MFEVKYRGVAAVNNFRPTQSLPRPGGAEAAACLKVISQREKVSQLVVLSVSTEEGIRCFDTTVNPPRMVFACSVYEIAHCGQHPANPVYFSMIIGSRDRPDLFLCHAFKCQSKDASMKITRAVAAACTQAYDSIRERRASQSASTAAAAGIARQGSQMRNLGTASNQGSSASLTLTRGSAQSDGGTGRASVRRQAPPGTIPKLTDGWFRPTASRDEVPQILMNSEIGDFVVRQSQSQPGDYAISVQTGATQLWTGLIVSTDRGYQLGQKGGRQFPDLTDLIAFYTVTPFMKDVMDRPLVLRLMDTGRSKAASEQRSPPAEAEDNEPRMVRKPTFKNPPLDFMSSKAAARALEVSQTPACGWPESTDEEEEEDNEAFSSKKKATNKKKDLNQSQELSEQEMFEKFMNNQIGKDGEEIEFVDDEEEEDDDDDDDLEALRVASLEQNSPPKQNVGGPPRLSNQSSNVSVGFDDDFVPPPSGKSSASKPGSQQSLPVQKLQISNDEPPLLPLTQYIFESLPRDAEDCISGADVRPVLMRSGLSTAMLGQIWMEVDLARKGKIDFEQLGLILGLISQAQEGGAIQLEALDPDTIAAPRMEGLSPEKYSASA